MNTKGGYRAIQVAHEVREDPKAQKYLEGKYPSILLKV
jgi:hypothetical protein